MSSMHSLIWFYDIEALTIFQLAQMAGTSGQNQWGEPGTVQAYLQQWLILITVLIGFTALLGLYGVFHQRLRLPKTQALVLLLLLAALIFVPVTWQGIDDIQTTGDARSELNQLADGLRQSSDDLTRMVRLYAVTGDPVYREYFEEILDIRNGLAPRPEQYFDIPYWDIVLATGERPGAFGSPVSIQTLMQRAGIRPGEVVLLEQAEEQSNILAEIEVEIMDSVAALVADGEYALEGAAIEALQRLHGQEYHDAKALVMQPLVELVASSGLGMMVAEGNVHNFLQERLDILTILIVAAAVFVAFIVVRQLPQRPWLYALALLVLLGSALLTQQILANSDVSGLNAARGQGKVLLSDGLRQTSDDLTRMARLYAVTGEDRYREYFQEILDIRNGVAPRPELYFQVPYWDFVLAINQRLGEAGDTVAIRTLMQSVGISTAEAALLTEAEDQSNILAELENEAMDAVARQVEAGGEYVLEGEALAAMQRLHGAEYHEAKARVMQPLVDLARLFEQELREEERFNRDDFTSVMNTLAAALVLAALLVAVSVYRARREDMAEAA